MATGTGDVKRTCANCEHASFGQAGVHCTLFHEDIWLEEKVAMECAEFDPVPWARSAKGVV